VPQKLEKLLEEPALERVLERQSRFADNRILLDLPEPEQLETKEKCPISPAQAVLLPMVMIAPIKPATATVSDARHFSAAKEETREEPVATVTAVSAKATETKAAGPGAKAAPVVTPVAAAKAAPIVAPAAKAAAPIVAPAAAAKAAAPVFAAAAAAAAAPKKEEPKGSIADEEEEDYGDMEFSLFDDDYGGGSYATYVPTRPAVTQPPPAAQAYVPSPARAPAPQKPKPKEAEEEDGDMGFGLFDGDGDGGGGGSYSFAYAPARAAAPASAAASARFCDTRIEEEEEDCDMGFSLFGDDDDCYGGGGGYVSSRFTDVRSDERVRTAPAAAPVPKSEAPTIAHHQRRGRTIMPGMCLKF